MASKQTFTVQFQHLILEIRYSPRPFASAEIEHYEIITLEPAGTCHPLSETGYKSLFIHPGWTKQFQGDPKAFIDFALEEAAKKPAWKDYLSKTAQLSLF